MAMVLEAESFDLCMRRFQTCVDCPKERIVEDTGGQQYETMAEPEAMAT